MPKPTPNPCPYCRATRFAWIDEAKIEVVSDAKIGFGNVIHLQVSLLACRGCGHAAWFLRDHEEQLEKIEFDERRAPDEAYR